MAPSFARGPPIDWGIDPIEPGWQVKEDEGKSQPPISRKLAGAIVKRLGAYPQR
jgi:hypothetical protein